MHDAWNRLIVCAENRNMIRHTLTAHDDDGLPTELDVLLLAMETQQFHIFAPRFSHSISYLEFIFEWNCFLLYNFFSPIWLPMVHDSVHRMTGVAVTNAHTHTQRFCRKNSNKSAADMIVKWEFVWPYFISNFIYGTKIWLIFVNDHAFILHLVWMWCCYSSPVSCYCIRGVGVARDDWRHIAYEHIFFFFSAHSRLCL